MSEQPHPAGPAKEVIAPPHLSLRKEVGRSAGPPPLEYGEVRLWLVARDSHSLFAYWEFRPDEHPEAIGLDRRARFFLRIWGDGEIDPESTQEIEPVAGQCTAAAKHSDTPYHAELGFFNSQDVWCFMAKSGTARTPPAEPPEPGTSPESANAQSPDAAAEGQGEAWSPDQEIRLSALLAEDIARNATAQPAAKRRKSPPGK